jgi:hypothetical protein
LRQGKRDIRQAERNGNHFSGLLNNRCRERFPGSLKGLLFFLGKIIQAFSKVKALSIIHVT